MPRKPAKPPKLKADYIPGGKSPAATKPTRFKVRCLGPGKDHTFMSTDPTSHRVCDACRRRRANPMYGKLALLPVSVSYGVPGFADLPNGSKRRNKSVSSG